MTSSATIRPSDLLSRWKDRGADRRNANRLLTCDLPDRSNWGGASAHFGAQALHQFFGQVGKTDPSTRLSQTVLSRRETMGEIDLTMEQKNAVGFAKNAKNIQPADLVAEAARWAAHLTDQAESKTGTTDAALETVARQTGVNHSTLWRLRYRKPKDIAASVYLKLKTAFEAAEQRQLERLNHELEVARSVGEASDGVLLRGIAALAEGHAAKDHGKMNNGPSDD